MPREVVVKRVWIIGAGKVGRALQRALREARVEVTLRAFRDGPPRRRLAQRDLFVLAVRDGAIADCARALAPVLPRRACVAHCAGAREADVLADLRAEPVLAAVTQLHPLIAIAHPRRAPPLAGAWMHVRGDPRAAKIGRALARRIGMQPFTLPDEVSAARYHALAALVANGAAALTAVADADPASPGGAALAALLASVAQNAAALSPSAALTGPVRRGDAATIARHQALLAGSPLAALYRALVAAQLPLARSLGEAAKTDFAAIERGLRRK